MPTIFFWVFCYIALSLSFDSLPKQSPYQLVHMLLLFSCAQICPQFLMSFCRPYAFSFLT
ncbi:hypothetical protein DL96DRAFT_1613439 [Flagelloscypha sp. PMI_526]|nr:hypothetical protein DL96DRAFT_1613439 [Flagelloscypha sp. PMI_526]